MNAERSAELEALLVDCRTSMSPFQLDHFVTGKQPTDFGMYRQALIELRGRKDAVEEIEIELRSIEADLAAISRRILPSISRAARERARIHREKIELRRMRTRRMLASTLEALDRFEGHVRKLKPIFADADLAALEAEYWVETIRRRIALEIACEGRISASSVEQVWALPAEHRAKAIPIMYDESRRVDFLKEREEAAAIALG